MPEANTRRTETRHRHHPSVRHPTLAGAVLRDPPAKRSSRINWMAVAKEAHHRQLGPGPDVPAWAPFRARSLVLRGPGAAVRSQWHRIVRWTLKNLPGRVRNLHVGAYAPRAQSRLLARDQHIPKLERENPRLLLLQPPMLPVTILRKVADLGAFLLKEAISRRVLQVQRKEGPILPRRQENSTNRQRDRVLKNLTIKDPDPKVLKMIKVTMNQTSPSNRQVCAIMYSYANVPIVWYFDHL